MFSLKIRNYKCFGSEQGFEQLKRINIVIGKNNVGKSSLLDLIRFSTESHFKTPPITWHNGNKPQLLFKTLISKDAIHQTFSANTSGGRIRTNHLSYGRKFINREIIMSQSPNTEVKEFIYCDDNHITPPLSETEYKNPLVNKLPIPTNNKIFRKLSAERDIKREKDRSNIMDLSINGDGVTSIIQSYINKIQYPSRIIEKTLLEKLNEVYNPDACFIDIVCQQYETSEWEIFLEEDKKGRIPLSESGSSLKTVILVLTYLLILPHLEGKPLSSYIFAFEELENNLHPSLLRRLLHLLNKSSEINNFMVFLTTHSNIMIDLFNKNKDAQIIHVFKNENENEIQCKSVITYIDNKGILDDLDIKASDLLQSNGIIWVEGPSDRIYLNKWIELWTNNTLLEGTHYQCIFYGGRLLSHLDGDDPEIINSTISLLRVNRNSIIIIDSDKRDENTSLNTTKLRILSEFQEMEQTAWVTKGREIENYLPLQAISKVIEKKINIKIEQYDCIFDKLEEIEKSLGKKYRNQKSLFAEKIITFLNIEMMKQCYDLNDKMVQVCKTIREWNKIKK